MGTSTTDGAAPRRFKSKVFALKTKVRTKLKTITPVLFNAISQSAHVWFAGCVALVPEALYRWTHWTTTWWYFLIWMGVAAWKEFYWDLNNEDEDVRGSDLEDFLFYCLGMFGFKGLMLLAGVLWG